MKQTEANAAAITIFGAKGDLTRRKLIPAFYNLFLGNHLPAISTIICVDFMAIDENEFKNDLLLGVNEFSRSGKADSHTWSAFAARLQYIMGDFKKEETFINLKAKLDVFDANNKIRGIRMFYFAVSPKFIEVIADGLYTHQIAPQRTKDRIVVEKPFGTDLQSAQKLNRFLRKRFAEQQIYRIDHYLGKETVQNILAFRFANYVFEP